jgi:hypothetical protein
MTGNKRVTSYKPSLKKELPSKVKSCKKWESLQQLDPKLVEMHCYGLLDCDDKSAKISQLILTEEYCRLKIYRSSLEKRLKEVEFSMSEC